MTKPIMYGVPGIGKSALILDEFKTVKPSHKKALTDFILQRPALGKSKALKKAIKKANKRRKKLGLKKIKVVEFKTPKGWDVVDLMGLPSWEK